MIERGLEYLGFCDSVVSKTPWVMILREAQYHQKPGFYAVAAPKRPEVMILREA